MDAVPFGPHDRFEVVDRLLRVGFLVDDQVFEVPNEGELVVRDLEARGDLLVRLGSPRLEARAEMRELVGDDEDEDGATERALDGQRSVDLGLRDDVVPGPERLVDERTRRPVEMAVVLPVLQELTGVTAPFELRPSQKEVIDALTLPGAR